MERPARITVVVAILPDHGCVDELIDGLARQAPETEPFTLLLIDARPAADRDGAGHVAAAAAAGLDTRYLPAERPSRAAAHNLGIRLATTELVLLLAHDFVPDRRLVASHLALHDEHEDPDVVGVGPGLFPPRHRTTRFQRWLEDSGALFGVPLVGAGPEPASQFFYAANTSATRTLLIDSGLFDEAFPHDAWDDYELGLRLLQRGMRTTFLPSAIAWHEHPITLNERRASMQRAGEAAVIVETKHEGPHAWWPQCGRPAWRLASSAEWHRLRAALPGGTKAREAFFRLTLEHAFVKSYRAAAFRRGRWPPIPSPAPGAAVAPRAGAR